MLTLLFYTLFTAVPDTLPPDGPYLVYTAADSLQAFWADTEARTTGTLPFDSAHFADLPRFPAFDPGLVDPARDFSPRPWRDYEGVSRVVAISDVHGQYDVTRRLLTANAVTDTAGHWVFGDGHLVIVGDVFDRGDQVTECLWFLHNLEGEAERAGGRVHFLLGNHETMVLAGDERYLNPRYRTTASLLQEFYGDLYGPDTYLGRWLRSLPLAVKINGVVYVHGGLSRDMVREVGSLERMNDLYHAYLIDADDLSETVRESNRLRLLYGRSGPLWYRGYFSANNFSADDLKYILRRVDAERIVVGHTSFTAVRGFFDNRIIAVDSSIKFGNVGEVLIVEGGDCYRGTITGKRIPLAGTAGR